MQIQEISITLPDPIEELKKVENQESFYASNSELYAMAEFGRDTRQLAADALIFDPSITKKVIRALVKRQAWKRNDITEAQPGKFHHEHRELFVNGERIPQHSEEILSQLAAKWGGTPERITYYGSYDITPDTVSLIIDVAKQDESILSEKIVNQDRKSKVSIKESVRQGVQWVQDRILYGPTQTPHNDIVQKFLEKSNLNYFTPAYHNYILRNVEWFTQRLGHVGQQLKLPFPSPIKRLKLLEFQRTNKHGITYQGWMDGGTSLIHSGPALEGILADYSQPIATVEMQASAIDALEKAAFLFPKKTKRFRRLADEVRRNVLEYLWMDEASFFAMGIDHDKSGQPRRLATLAANAGELLNSTFFDTMTSTEKVFYITAIVKKLFSDDFLTDVGIRTRAKRYAFLTDISPEKNQPNSRYDYWDYQGSETVWIVQTGRIAEGLRRQGFYRLAEQLDNRTLNAVHISGSHLEYLYVGARGSLEDTVGYQVKDIQSPHINEKNIATIYATNIPEASQTWTASRIAAIKHRRNNPEAYNEQYLTWQKEVEEEVLHNLTVRGKVIHAIENPLDILTVRKNANTFIVDRKRGLELEQHLVKQSESFHKH